MLEIIRGNLVKQEADAIINPINSDIVFDKGIPFFIKRNGGDKVEREALKHYPSKLGDVFLTEGGNLLVKKVIHLINRQFGKRTSYVLLVNALKNALLLAHSKQLKSIAIPPIYNRFSPQITANILCDAIKLAVEEESSIKNLKLSIVIFDKDTHLLFEKIFQEKIPELL